jgi:hypothetical protein
MGGFTDVDKRIVGDKALISNQFSREWLVYKKEVLPTFMPGLSFKVFIQPH